MHSTFIVNKLICIKFFAFIGGHSAQANIHSKEKAHGEDDLRITDPV
jgi:hypothetical protein